MSDPVVHWEIGGPDLDALQPPTAIDTTMSFALFTDPGGAVVGLLQRRDT
ncbi:VOC family protein [Nocardia wallacei]|nr:hypothetical protein [Nocardia wallacei]